MKTRPLMMRLSLLRAEQQKTGRQGLEERHSSTRCLRRRRAEGEGKEARRREGKAGGAEDPEVKGEPDEEALGNQEPVLNRKLNGGIGWWNRGGIGWNGGEIKTFKSPFFPLSSA
jgi:hypothetical protein